ncbi:MAG: C40 family peptidase [Bacteroidales bacterium]|nr:C40 family peptidase [Bacteroidales bacterium]
MRLAGRLAVAVMLAAATQLQAQDSLTVSLDSVVAYAATYLGSPYRWGGQSPKGFDCAGFTRFVFRHFGQDLASSAAAQLPQGRRLDDGDLRPGDLVFYGGRNAGSAIGHVGMVTEVDSAGFRFIHAASDGVRFTRSTEPYYKKRYKGACRPRILDTDRP